MKARPEKPRKVDFIDMQEFLKASATWAEIYNQWPWGNWKDEDDNFYYTVNDETRSTNQS